MNVDTRRIGACEGPRRRGIFSGTPPAGPAAAPTLCVRQLAGTRSWEGRMPDHANSDQTKKTEPKNDIKDLPKDEKDARRIAAEADKVKGGGVRDHSV